MNGNLSLKVDLDSDIAAAALKKYLNLLMQRAILECKQVEPYLIVGNQDAARVASYYSGQAHVVTAMLAVLDGQVSMGQLDTDSTALEMFLQERERNLKN